MGLNQPNIDSLLVGARRAGLPLTEEEAAELVKGVTRLQEMARTVRELLEPGTEPSPVFAANQERAS